MKIEIQMPKMGESLQEGTIIKWLKNIGDKIERDEMILEISTDKVDTEVPSPVAGVLVNILAKENETVEVGAVIAIIESDVNFTISKSNQDIESIPEQKIINNTMNTSENIIDIVMPKMGESLQEGTIIKWLKNIGDKIERDEMILEISTDKVDTEVPSPVEGILKEILVNANETVSVGSVIARIAGSTKTVKPNNTDTNTVQSIAETENNSVSQAQNSETFEAEVGEIPRKHGDKFFSPLVRSIAKSEGITLKELLSIVGSGIDGRITKNDLFNYIKNRQAPIAVVKKASSEITIKQQPGKPVQKIEPQVIPSVYGKSQEIIPMDRVRQLIAEHMVFSKSTSAHVTSVAEADVTGLVNYRNKNKEEFEKHEGFKLTYTPFFSKAIIDGVKQFPMVNVSVDEKNIIRHLRINLGIATALPDGNLIVPVIKNADSLNISGLARSIFDLSSRARIKKLNPEEIQGGTISLTNVGTFGTLFGTPIINQPQCAIIAVGAIKKRPVVININNEDVIAIRSMMYVSITYDHRVIDGMLAGQCLAAIVHSLESMNETTISF